MTKQKFDINRLRVASPCSVGWETMTGDERVRRCQSCELSVYNIAELTGSEAEDLIHAREGRLCIRLYRRVDGTVLTKDCPVGLRAYQKRAARLAGTALAAVLGLFSISFGQKAEKKPIDASKVKIIKTVNQDQASVLTGIVLDPYGVVVPNAQITLYQKKDPKNPFKTRTDDDGKYTFDSLPAGTYVLEIDKQIGFNEYKVVNIEIKEREKNQFDITLKGDGLTVIMGVMSDESTIDISSSSVKTTITRDMMDNFPH